MVPLILTHRREKLFMKQKFQSMMYRLNNKLQPFMVGRYGTDDFSRFISTMIMVCLVLSIFTKGNLFYWFGILLIIYSYYRIFSKNIPARYAENQKFLNIRYKAIVKWNLTKKHWAERKTHRFFKCPQCKQKVRVPKGRGKICITCPKCKADFIKKS